MSFNGAGRLHPESRKNPSLWEAWYAWHPVKVHGKWTWLKTVYRRHNWARSDTFNQEYDYGTIFDVLGDVGE